VDRGVAGFGEEDRAMFLGVVFGDDRDQGEWLGHLFKAAGISHLTAVSGQNVAFVLVAASPLLMALSLRWRWWATLAILGFFTLVTRAEPSVLRAVAMAGAVATAAVMGRSVSRWRGIAIAVMVLLVLDPLLVWSTGFRLSLAATLGIVGLSRPIADRLPGPSWLREPASVMLSAQVATAPVLVTFVAGIPLAAVGTNLVAVPIAGALMVWGVVTAPIAGLLGGGAAWMLGVPSRFMVRSLIVIARIGAEPRWGFLNPTTAVLMSAGIAVWCLVPRQWSKRVLAGTGVVVLVWAALSWWTAAAMISAPSAELVTGSTGRALVIHPRARVRDVLTVVQQCACSRIDLLIVEHASRSSGEVVWRVRGLLEVGVVATDGPAVIRDAVALREGVIDLGGVRLAVTDEDTGWKVASVSSG
jgi:competence protein ComEC